MDKSAMNSEVHVYRYKLNNNMKSGSALVNGIKLWKKRWVTFQSEHDKLKTTVRTKKNPKGIVDQEIYLPRSNIVMMNTEKYFYEEPTKYTKDELGAMTRPELVPVAYMWGLNPVHKKVDLLRQLIITEQKAYIQSLKDRLTNKREQDRKDIDNANTTTEIPSEQGGGTASNG